MLCFTAAISLTRCISYGSIVVTPAAKHILNKDDRLYLDRKSSDSANLHDVLEHKLLHAGFQLKPEIFVKNQDEYLSKAKKAKDKSRDYVLEYSYHSRKTFLIGTIIVDRFDGRLIEFESKKNVFSIKFEGKRSVTSFANEFVTTLVRISEREGKTQ